MIEPLCGWVVKRNATNSYWKRRYLWVDDTKGWLHLAKRPGGEATSRFSRRTEGSTVFSLSEVTEVRRAKPGEVKSPDPRALDSCFVVRQTPITLVVGAHSSDDAARWVARLNERVADWRERRRLEMIKGFGSSVAVNVTLGKPLSKEARLSKDASGGETASAAPVSDTEEVLSDDDDDESVLSESERHLAILMPQSRRDLKGGERGALGEGPVWVE